MVCDEIPSDQRLPYNNIYGNGTRSSPTETNTTENPDYTSNIESVEAAANAGGSFYPQNGEPPQMEGKQNFHKKVPTRYVLVIMGFLAFVNMYMMYLNVTVAWPAMVDHNATKLGTLDDRKGVFFEKSDINTDFIKQNIPFPNSQSKNSHRKESHKQRKRKRKTEAFDVQKNINEGIPPQTQKYIVTKKTSTPQIPPSESISIPQQRKRSISHEVPKRKIAKKQNFKMSPEVYEMKTVETINRPVQVFTKDQPQKEIFKYKNDTKVKSRKRKRRSSQPKEDNTDHRNVQVISIIPKVVIKSINNQIMSSTTTATPIITEVALNETSSLIENYTEIPVTSTTDITEVLELSGNSSSQSNSTASVNSEKTTNYTSGLRTDQTDLVENRNIKSNYQRSLSLENQTGMPTAGNSSEITNSESSQEEILLIEETTENFLVPEIETTDTTTNAESIDSITTEISTPPEQGVSSLLVKSSYTTLEEPKDFIIGSNLDINISLPIVENTTKSVNFSSINNSPVDELNNTFSSAILPLLKTSLHINSDTPNIRRNEYHVNCWIDPKSCLPTLLEDIGINKANVGNLHYQINSILSPPIQPPFIVRDKKDPKVNEDSEEKNDDSDEYRIKKITFDFGKWLNNCTQFPKGINCPNNLNVLSMSIFFDHSSSSSSSSEEDDDEEDSEEEEDDEEDDEDEGGEDEDEEEENDEDGLWDDEEGNLDDIQLQELYFDNSTDLFKRYDQNDTGGVLDGEYLNENDPSNRNISPNWIDEVQYEGSLCNASSEECEEKPEAESTDKVAEPEIKEEEEEEKEKGKDKEKDKEKEKKKEKTIEPVATIPHRTEGLITLHNEKIPSTVCFYKEKTSTSFEGYDDGEFAWEPEKLSEVTSAYYWGFLISQIVAGRLTSQFGGKLVLVQGILFAGIITLLTPFLGKIGLYWLLIGRLFLGMMLGLVMPAMHALLAKWAPPMERTKMVAYAYSGIAIGAAAGGPLSAYLVQRVGWQILFYAQGISAILWCILFLLIIYESPNKHKRISQKEKQYILGAIGQQHTGQGLPVPWCSIIR